MKLAICIPCFNDKIYLEQMINSIRSKHPYKLFIWDNSTNEDVSYYIHMECEVDNKYFRAFKNYGISKGANGSIEMAYNDPEITHILYCNSDIVFDENTIDALIWAWDNKENEKIKVISATEFRVHDKNVKETWEKLKLYPKTHHSFNLGCCYTCFIMDKSTIDSCGYFNEDVDYYDDNIYSVEMMKKGFIPLVFYSAPLFHYGSIGLDSKSKEEMEEHHKKFQSDREYAFSLIGVKSQEELHDFQIDMAKQFSKDLAELNERIKNKNKDYLNYPMEIK